MPETRYYIDLDKPTHDFAKSCDVWAFSGRNAYSRLIAMSTCSFSQLWYQELFSHLAISSRFFNLHKDSSPVELLPDVYKYSQQVLLYESTELVDQACCLTGVSHTGVQAHPIIERIKNYDGSVWRFRLNRDFSFGLEDEVKLNKFIMHHLGEGYDTWDAYLSATWRLRLARCVRHDIQRRFCSDLVLDAMRHCGVLGINISPKSYNPARAIRDLCFWGILQSRCRCQIGLYKCMETCESILVKEVLC